MNNFPKTAIGIMPNDDQMASSCWLLSFLKNSLLQIHTSLAKDSPNKYKPSNQQHFHLREYIQKQCIPSIEQAWSSSPNTSTYIDKQSWKLCILPNNQERLQALTPQQPPTHTRNLSMMNIKWGMVEVKHNLSPMGTCGIKTVLPLLHGVPYMWIV